MDAKLGMTLMILVTGFFFSGVGFVLGWTACTLRNDMNNLRH